MILLENIKGIVANGDLFPHRVTLPYSYSGVLIEKNSAYIKVSAKLGLVAMWNGKDAFMVSGYNTLFLKAMWIAYKLSLSFQLLISPIIE